MTGGCSGTPVTTACRILDPADGTVRAGTEAECRQAFATLEADGTIPPQDGGTVVLLHGLGEGRDSMRPLAEHLRAGLDATVICFGYASVAADIDDPRPVPGQAWSPACRPAARSASSATASATSSSAAGWPWPAPRIAARVHRVVMLGPPNQGSQLARMAAGLRGSTGMWTAPPGNSSTTGQRVAPQLAVPGCDFGIVAGGKGDDAGYSLLLDGDDDAVVCVAETRLPGARDFLLVPVHHAAMMRDPTVQQATESFLKTGRFTGHSSDGAGGTMTEPESAALPAGRVAGVDYGRRRIGVAVCDAAADHRQPACASTRRPATTRPMRLSFAISSADEELVGFVVGLPLHADGGDSEMSAEVERFAAWLDRTTGLPVAFQDERYSSHEAAGKLAGVGLTRAGKKKRSDAVAAQVVLVSWMERQAASRGPNRA